MAQSISYEGLRVVHMSKLKRKSHFDFIQIIKSIKINHATFIQSIILPHVYNILKETTIINN